MQEIQQIKQRFGIIGQDERLYAAIRVALQVSPTDLSVLVVGESGVGKEFFPKIIHAYSARKHNKYIAVNCGAIPEGTIDSELFGHRKGSFTGAVNDRKGYFEEADGGTIFLDEIGEMPLSTQARLLRVLENGEFIPVGASQPQKTDVRIVAATNVRLDEAMRQGKFREDLYYRLSTVPIVVPALRERSGDIALLFRKFAGDNAARYGIPPIELDAGASKLLETYRWPGNIRELKNTVDRMSLLEEQRLISPAVLRNYLSPEGLVDLHPVVVTKREEQDGPTPEGDEREFFYKVLYEMSRNVAELKKEVTELKKGSHHIEPSPVSSLDETHYIIPDNPIFDQEEATEEDKEGGSISVNLLRETPKSPQQAIEALAGVPLETIERMAILQALKRNDGARAATAQELGIAERTLYRRLKDYGVL